MNLQKLIDQLLFEEEGDSLDFKSEQYRFSGATDKDKSELLKDIIAFANAWRRTDAYILIGVKEVKGGRSEVVGISEHLDDAQLQEFINYKTQRPIDFSYKTVQHGEVQIGVIHIPVQRRPFYLKKDFGRLKKNEIHVRRGSSTAIASPDEISTMGGETKDVYRDTPVLEAFLISGQHDENLEKRVKCKLINAKIPEQFPDYDNNEYIDICGRRVQTTFKINSNRDYYREKAKYFQEFGRVHAFKLGIKNSGVIVARDVKVIFDIEDAIACKRDCLPSMPRSDNDLFSPLHNSSINRADVLIQSTLRGYRITCHLGKIQPKDTSITRDYFYLGTCISKSVQIGLQVFSDDLPEPKQETLVVDFEVEDRIYSVDDLIVL